MGKRAKVSREETMSPKRVKAKLAKIHAQFFDKLEVLAEIAGKSSRESVTRNVILRILGNYLKRRGLKVEKAEAPDKSSSVEEK